MCARSSDDPRRAVADHLRQASSLLVLTHDRPDGDAFGSMTALVRAARAAGKDAWGVVDSRDALEGYRAMLDGWEPREPAQVDDLAERADRIVVVDTASFQQLTAVQQVVQRHRDKIVVVDHHPSPQQVGMCQWIDPSAAAAAVMVGELLGELDWPLDAEAALALLTGTLTDTGWLRFSNTDARALRAAADWVDRGVDVADLYGRLYQNDPPQRLRLLQRALDSLELHEQDRVAMMSLSLDDFARTGATPESTDGFVNEPFRVRTVEVVMLTTQTQEGVRVSFRSRRYVDVSALAAQFGGGGHVRAAGARLDCTIDQAREQLLQAVQPLLDPPSP